METVKKFLTKDSRLRAAAVISTEIVRESGKIQKTFPLATLGLGRLVTGSLLMASQLAEEQKISVRYHGDGPLGTLFAEASFEGKVRAYCQNPHLDLPPNKKGQLDIVKAIGNGHLSVARILPFQKEPHIGIVPILTGEVGEDIAYYLHQSHQVPSIVALSVSLDKDGSVRAAGGVIVELLPEAPTSLIPALEAKAATAIAISQQILSGRSEADMVRSLVHDDVVQVDHEYSIKFECPCSNERVERTLQLLGRAALAEMALKNEAVLVNCQFCGQTYSVSADRVRELHHKLESN